MSTTEQSIGTTEVFFTFNSRRLKACIWYPAECNFNKRDTYLNLFRSTAYENAKIREGIYPLLLISHGSNGHRFTHYFLAEYLAYNGFIVLSFEQKIISANLNNRWQELWNKPAQIKHILENLSSLWIARFIDYEKIGIIGHSAGGFAALVVAGGAPTFEYEPEFFPVRDQLAMQNFQQLQDARVKALFLMAPALSNLFTKETLKEVDLPIMIVYSGQDEVNMLGTPEDYIEKLSFQPKIHFFPHAGHFVYTAVCPALLEKLTPSVCVDTGMPRSEVHLVLKQLAHSFFDKKLSHEIHD